MHGFILEILAGRTWKRKGRTFWTRQAAVNEAKLLIGRGRAQEVRILPIRVSGDAVESLTAAATTEAVK